MRPVLGVLGWEAGNEDTLPQLEQIPGDIAHPGTFRFPILYRRVPGAYYETVVVRPDERVLAAMIEAAHELERAGVGAITTACGFNALFQHELADAVGVPLFASSLIQVPLVLRMLRTGEAVGILTADAPYLTAAHLQAVGVDDVAAVMVRGVEETGEFRKIRADPKASLDVGQFQDQVVTVARALLADHPQVRAFVLECTDLPPFAAAIRRATGLPVFDIVTLAHMVVEALAGDRWPH